MHFIPSDRQALSTYSAMDRSAVVVAFCSTAALEAFGWGKKVLFCNLFKDITQFLPEDGLWAVQEPDYEVFKTKLNRLRGIEEAEYREATKEYARYLMSYDFRMPAHKYIKDMLLRQLENGRATSVR